MELFAFNCTDILVHARLFCAHSYLLSTYYVSGTILSAGDMAVMKTDKNPFFPGTGAHVAGAEAGPGLGGCGVVGCGTARAEARETPRRPWRVMVSHLRGLFQPL